jgi:hypothetical protein
MLVAANLLAQRFYLFFDVFRGRHRRKIICKERLARPCAEVRAAVAHEILRFA